MMMPAPMPVATLSMTIDRCWVWFAAYSPVAMALASLSTMTGQSKVSANQERTGNRFHPVMMGGWMTVPDAKSTGPGSARPIPRTKPGSTASWSRSSRNIADTSASQASGPMVMSRGVDVSWWILPSRSVMAVRTPVAPASARRRAPLSSRKRNWLGGRPRPATAAPPVVTSPAACSAASRLVTVDRARPVCSSTSARVSRRPGG